MHKPTDSVANMSCHGGCAIKEGADEIGWLLGILVCDAYLFVAVPLGGPALGDLVHGFAFYLSIAIIIT